jgi:Rrf2 family protein
MMSSKAKYAVRAAMLLADRQPEGCWTQTATIAEAGDIPRKFLEAILVELRDHGLVTSRRGPGGGHRLAQDAALIMVGDIIRIVEGQLALTPCSSRRHFRACADCVDVATCRLRHLMLRARDAVAEVLDTYSLADLALSGAPEVVNP